MRAFMQTQTTLMSFSDTSPINAKEERKKRNPTYIRSPLASFHPRAIRSKQEAESMALQTKKNASVTPHTSLGSPVAFFRPPAIRSKQEAVSVALVERPTCYPA